MPSRSRAREQALQILYLMDLAGTPPEEALPLFEVNFGKKKEDFEFVRSLVTGVRDHASAIDEKIEKFSDHWRISRMPRIDRSILRLGTYEICFSGSTPFAVALDEAVELGKKYGDTKTGAFVNGILDRISKEMGNR